MFKANNKDDAVLVSLLLTLNIFHILFLVLVLLVLERQIFAEVVE